MTGIYTIVNTESGKVYVGQTGVDTAHRWTQHRSDLRAGRHRNSHLQRAWNLYGEDAFKFVICEYVEDAEQLYIREQYWLDWHRLQTEVYNTGACAACPTLGTHMSDSACAKMSAARKGCKHTPGHCAKIGAGNAGLYPALLNVFTGAREPAGKNLAALCRRVGARRGAMSRVIRGKRRHHHGWVVNTPTAIEDYEASCKEHNAKLGVANKGNTYCVGRVVSEETRRKISESQKRRHARRREAAAPLVEVG